MRDGQMMAAWMEDGWCVDGLITGTIKIDAGGNE